MKGRYIRGFGGSQKPDERKWGKFASCSGGLGMVEAAVMALTRPRKSCLGAAQNLASNDVLFDA
ncbi:MAG TPA: hypothetical protein VNL74_09375 [Methylococcus sp.]|nr:hypothetical protein [Methylococcus sp.]